MSILLLFEYIQRNKAVMGFVMPSQQTEQLIQTALQAPLNNLVVFGIILALIIVLGGGGLVYKFMPVILKQIQQLIDNNTKLTTIAERSADAADVAMKAADKNAGELVKQTGLLSDTVSLLTDFKNFQKLNNDQTADVGLKVESLTTVVAVIPESVADLKADIARRFDDIDAKLAELLKKADCVDIKTEWDLFGQSFFERLNKIIPPQPAPASNLLTDDAKPASEAAKKPEAA